MDKDEEDGAEWNCSMLPDLCRSFLGCDAPADDVRFLTARRMENERKYAERLAMQLAENQRIEMMPKSCSSGQ